MTYYDAMTAKWATLSGTTAAKLAALNAATAAGPRVNVDVSTMVGFLMLGGAYLKLAAFAQSVANSDTTHDNALGAAKMLMALISSPNAPQFTMTDPTKYAAIKSLLDTIQAEETAVAGSTGITQQIHDGLLALCETQVPWWKANLYPRPFDMGDVQAAGVQ